MKGSGFRRSDLRLAWEAVAGSVALRLAAIVAGSGPGGVPRLEKSLLRGQKLVGERAAEIQRRKSSHEQRAISFAVPSNLDGTEIGSPCELVGQRSL